MEIDSETMHYPLSAVQREIDIIPVDALLLGTRSMAQNR
jgi:hypothetical protein